MVGVRVGLVHHQGIRGPLVHLLHLALLPDLLPVMAPVFAPSQVVKALVRCTWVGIARAYVYSISIAHAHTAVHVHAACLCVLSNVHVVCYLYAACVRTTCAHRTCALCRAQAAHANPRL